MTVKLPYIKWRDGRPRLVHSPRERNLGFVDRDLKHPNGEWFTYEQTAEIAAENVKAIVAARAAGKPVKMPTRTATVEDLINDWLASGEVTKLSTASIVSYQKAARAVKFKPETRTDAAERRKREKALAVLGQPIPERDREPFVLETPSAIGAPELRDFYNYLRAARGHHMAISAIAAISAAFTWGRESSKWRLGRNPRLEMQFDRPDGRIVLITLEEFHALVAAADSPILNRPSIGDAIYLGLFTGQRQTDRLNMKDDGIVNGRRQLKQSKTGTIVAIKEAPQLAARLAKARARVKKLNVSGLQPTIVVDETTGRAYNEHTYRHLFADVRELAIKGHAGHPPCPSLGFINERTGLHDYKHDQDLRDTCVILLDRAGNDLLSICDVTGHSYQSAQLIMKSYRARNAARADVAIDKLVDFISKEGMA